MSQPQSVEVPSPEPGKVAPRGTGAGYSRRGSLFAIGAATAVVAVPLALKLGLWWSTRPSNTLLAVVPALLVVLLVPPLAVVVAESVWVRRVGSKLRTGVAVGAAVGAQLVTLAAAIGAGVSAPRYGDAVLLTMVEALVLPLVVTRLAYQSSETPTPSPLSKHSLPLCLVLVLTLSRSAGAFCPERDAWPTKAWPTAALPEGHEEALKAFEEYAFTLEGQDEERKGIRTDGVVIIHRGRLVYERYARGFEARHRHLGWSMTKSVTNALTGLAVTQGALKLEDSICKYVKATNEKACAITVRNLLEFGSGLDWKEAYEGGPLQTSSVLAMLYGEGRRDTVAFITSHALRDTPGTSWEYSSGDTTLLAGVVGAAMKQKLGDGWEWKLLFDPLGVRSAVMERDNKGVLVGSSLMHATPRDWAKLGFFFLNDGCWEGQRLLMEGWVAASTAASEPLKGKRVDWDPGDVQGWQFWLNLQVPGVQEEKPWPNVPEDAFAMRGHWGQSVTIIPSMDMVVVRTSDDRQPGAFKLDTFLARAIALVGGRP